MAPLLSGDYLKNFAKNTKNKYTLSVPSLYTATRMVERMNKNLRNFLEVNKGEEEASSKNSQLA